MPEGLKKIFILNGFNNKFIFSKLEETDITDTEIFARELLPDLIETSEYPLYYGIFKNKYDKFKILTGLKKQIMCISSYYKDKLLLDKSPNIFSKTKKLVSKLPKKKKNISTSGIAHIAQQVSEESDDPMPKRQCVETLNIDLNKENILIAKKIKEWIQNNMFELYNNQDIEVSTQLDSHYQDTDTQEISYNLENKIKAKINCFICKLPVYIHKLSSSGRVNQRWVYSNYYKHIKTHQNKKELKSRDVGLKNGTLDNFIESYDTNKQTNKCGNKNKDLIATEILSVQFEKNDKDFDDSSVIEEANNICFNEINQMPTTSTTLMTSKWKSAKYQRSSRLKRQRERSLMTDKYQQSIITHFYPILDSVKKLLNKNKNLQKQLLDEMSSNLKVTTAFDSNGLLKYLYESALKNQKVTSKESQHHNRFDDTLKKFSTYLFIIGGRLL